MKLTLKQVKERYNCIKVGYAEVQHLMIGAHKIGYTSGVYGWNADVYLINSNTVVITGYRPFGELVPTRELTQFHEERARHTMNNGTIPYDQRMKQLETIRFHYINEVMKEITIL